MRDIMNHIAGRLGWYELPLPHAWGSEADVWRQDGTADKPLLPTDDPIVFAAYAKAEIAKRGWLIEYPYHGRDYHDLYICLMACGKCAKPFKYDPTDPVSEAEAVLCCIADALQSNSPFSGPSA